MYQTKKEHTMEDQTQIQEPVMTETQPTPQPEGRRKGWVRKDSKLKPLRWRPNSEKPKLP